MELFNFESVKIPERKEDIDKSGGYIRWGTKNNYPDYIHSLYKRSSNHASMVDNEVQRIIGSGFQSENLLEQEKIEKYKINEWLTGVARDFVLYGGYCTEVIWNELHTNILEINKTNLDRIRLGLIDEEYDEPTLYFYSTSFNDYTYSKRNKDISVLYTYDENPMTDNHQLLYNFGTNRVGNDKYPRADYESSIHWIETDSQIGVYYMNLIYNNFMVSNILQVPFLPNEQDRKSFEEGIKNKFVGPENAASTLVVYTSSPDQEIKLINVSGEQGEKRYDELNDMTINSLSRGHRLVSPMLAGISLPGNLYGISDLPSIERSYNKSVIYPKRQNILNDFNKFNKYLPEPLIDYTINDNNTFDEKTN